MIKVFLSSMTLMALGFCGAMAQTSPPSQSLLQAAMNLDWIDGPKNAFIVMPPIEIAKGKVKILTWSPDGHQLYFFYKPDVILGSDPLSLVEQALLGQLNPAPQDFVLAEWDDQTKKTQVVHSFGPLDDIPVSGLTWLKDKQTAFLTLFIDPQPQSSERYRQEVWRLSTKDQSLHFIDFGSDKYEVLSTAANPFSNDAVIQLSEAPAPTGKGGVYTYAEGNNPASDSPDQQVNLLVDSNGNIKRHLAPGAWEPEWTLSGDLVGVADGRYRRGSNGTLLPAYLSVDGDKAVSIKAPNAVWQATAVKPDFETSIGTAVQGSGVAKRSIATYWLKCPAKVQVPDLLMGSSIHRGAVTVSPENRAIEINSQEGLTVRLMYPVSDEVRKRLVAFAITKAMQKGKQVALGIFMYATDNDDNMPSAGQLGLLDPYLKDSSLLEGFNYQPPSDLNMTSWQSPADTVIGSVSGPGGQAVVYGDGHVKWQNGP